MQSKRSSIKQSSLVKARQIKQSQKVQKQDTEEEQLYSYQQSEQIEFQPYSKNAFYKSGCITCGKKNIRVQYFEDRHICLNCRKDIRYKRDKVHVFLNDEDEIIAIAQDQNSNFYNVPTNQIQIQGFNCYATLAGDNELIILLSDEQDQEVIDKYNRAVRKMKALQQFRLDINSEFAKKLFASNCSSQSEVQAEQAIEQSKSTHKMADYQRYIKYDPNKFLLTDTKGITEFQPLS